MSPDALVHSPVCAAFAIVLAASGYAVAMVVCVVRERQVGAALTAMAKCGWSKKEFAGYLGITAARLSKWIGGESPLDVDRLWRLPERFQVEYDAARAALRGAVVLEPEAIRLVHGFSAMSHPQMVKMTTPGRVSKEGVA